MAQAAGGCEPHARRRFALATGLIGTGVLAGCVVYGLVIAREIGPGLTVPYDGLFLAKLLEGLAQ